MAMSSDDVTHAKILYMLAWALVEIRAASDLDMAQKIADIVHNVPGQIMGGDSGDKIYRSILDRAERFGMANHVASWKRAANRHA
jgi:hypothetical protein